MKGLLKNQQRFSLKKKNTPTGANVFVLPLVAGCLITALHVSAASGGETASSGIALVASPGDTTYLVDPSQGNDNNPVGKPWKTYGKLNSIKLASGDKVVIAPGLQEETLKPMGGGTAEKPVVNHTDK